MSDLRPVPYLPGNTWTHYRGITRGALKLFQDCQAMGHPVVRLKLGPLRTFVACSPEAVRHVLLATNRKYDKNTPGFRALSIVAGDGLLTSDGEKWKRRRGQVQPLFDQKRQESFARIFTSEAQKCVERWKRHQGRLDVAEEMTEVTLKIIGKTLLGMDLEGGRFTEEVGVVLEVLRTRTAQAIKPPLWFPTGDNLRLRRGLGVINATAREILERADQDATGLLAAMKRQGLSDQEMIDEIKTFVLAGHETTANALSWAWYLLAENPDKARLLREEAQRVLGGRPAAWEDVPNLPYAQNCLQESFRLYPPAWILGRMALEDDELCGHAVPKGTLVLSSPWPIHRDPKLWDRPEAFLPERFESFEAQGNFSYFPFGGGARLCIGKTFAIVEGTILLATLAQHFVFKRAENSPNYGKIAAHITLRPEGGLPMNLESL